MSKKYQREFAVYGMQAVTALAAEHPHQVMRLFFAESRKKSFGQLCSLLAQQKRLYRVADDEELTKLAHSVHHQGVVAMISMPDMTLLERETIDTWAEQGSVVLFLDDVKNANNIGAIVRSAAFFGVSAVVLEKDTASLALTSAAYRVAEGGMEFVSVYTVSSAQWLLRNCSGKLAKVASSPHAFRQLRDLQRVLDPHEAVLLVLGNEETGIRAETQELCDHHIKIKGAGAIESLNVAQASSLFLSAIMDIKTRNV